MSKHLSGFQELLILLATVIVWPIIWSVMTGDNIWSNLPMGCRCYGGCVVLIFNKAE